MRSVFHYRLGRAVSVVLSVVTLPFAVDGAAPSVRPEVTVLPALSKAAGMGKTGWNRENQRRPLPDLPRGLAKVAIVRAGSPSLDQGSLRAAPAATFGFLKPTSFPGSTTPLSQNSAAKPRVLPFPRTPHSLSFTARGHLSAPPTVRPHLVTSSQIGVPPFSPASTTGLGVSLDSTLGQTGQPTISTDPDSTNHYRIDSGLGKWLAGGNLFFSFSSFTLAPGDSATFTNLAGRSGVQNLFARITSRQSSLIDGTIRSDIAGASLFLINPDGFVFGKNARLDLKGSFAVTTADYLTLASGDRFTSRASSSDDRLSAAPVCIFGFCSAKPGSVEFRGEPGHPTKLALPEGAAFTVVTGDQTIDATALAAPSGRLTLVSIAGPGEVPASPAALAEMAIGPGLALGSISLTRSASAGAITVGHAGAGHLALVARSVSLSESFLDASALEIPATAAGAALSTIQVRCDSLQMSGSTIAADGSGFGKGGDIEIQARTVSLLNLDNSPSLIGSSPVNQATSGNLTITADRLNIVNSSLQTSTFGTGAAGNITVHVANLRIKGSARVVDSGIFADGGGGALEPSSGRGGNVQVTAGFIALDGGGQISSRTFGSGRGGNVFVSSQEIRISGLSVSEGVVSHSGIIASANLSGSEGMAGAAGDIMIETGGLRVSQGGQIANGTVGPGAAGNTMIVADRVFLDGGDGAAGPTGALATTTFARGGRGGDLSITAGELHLRGGAEINASTLGRGAGGDIAIQAREADLSGERTRIAAQTLARDGGEGGTVRINAANINVRDGAQISASTNGSGQGGSVIVTTDRLTVTGTGSSIRADTAGHSGTFTTQPAIDDIGLTLHIDHPSDADLTAILYAPVQDGQRATTLFGKGDLSGANLVNTTFTDTGSLSIGEGGAPFTGTYRAMDSLSLLRGAGTNGEWTLFVSDSSKGNTGVLRSWSLTLNNHTFTFPGGRLDIKDFDHVSPALMVSLPLIRTQVKAGAGGNIRISAGTVDVLNGGTVSASTFGSGAAGAIQVHAGAVSIDASAATSSTGFFATTATGSAGHGGRIEITATAFRALGSSRAGVEAGAIARSSTGASAGDIVLLTGSARLDDGATLTSANLAGGKAGSVSVSASDSIVLQEGSVITALSKASDAGIIDLIARRSVELQSGSAVTASAGANGGNVAIVAGDLFLLDHSSLAATAGTSVTAGANGRGVGAGGNISVDPTTIILDHGLITANSALGAGGDITLQSEHFLSSESMLMANGRTAGTVEVIAPDLDLVAGLVGLPASVIDASTQLRELCASRLGLDFSSLLLLGTGGVPPSPDEAQASVKRMGRPARQ